MNVGFEVFGKDALFTRPVLILQKHNEYTFFGLPLGYTKKRNRYHHPIFFKDRQGSLLLSQGRVLDSRRLKDCMGKISDKKFEQAKKAYKNLF